MTDTSVPAGAVPSSVPGQSYMSARIEDYADALDTVKTMLLDGRELSVILQAVCVEVVSAVEGADMAGITVLEESGKHPETTASTDPRVHDVDGDQYRSDEGPCLEAARTRTMVRVRVAEAADRWPTFVSNVSDIGIASYLSAPVILDNKHLGALNIYSYSDHGFSDVDEALVRLFVTAVEAAVWISRRATSAEDEVEGLTTAMKTRATIEQAKGIIMALQGCTADEAFRILSTQSQQRNIKVADIAASIVELVPTRTRS
ncbi:GAF and ANTAR domain-containing protein [Rhodococcus fascians]|nr:GAF and ANTAR domain-containing protein [Rhodococcus fascians]MBY3995125.1 GAF and ANTAR domain-containing protein [Rhodococcus fascians]MBY4000555.1 GAF and ANTAR domain-containing protein [Rhodococcus fascians]MBY4005583.1 GAF and ANTAR domain-containing protein [Rhodococcus fascians]MBY4016416.1 GAF and ANTAR domain-containing protein [Rhodococcus fascians]